MRKILAIALVSLVVPPPQAFAQQDSGATVALNDAPVAVAASTDVASARLSSNISVRSGPLRTAIAREAARLSQSDTAPSSRQVAAQGWIARHPVQAGFWIGAAAGAAVGAAACARASEFAALCMAGGFGAGGGAGAYGGVIASAIGDKRRGQALSAKTKVGLVAGAAGLIVIGSATHGTFTW